MAVVLDWKIVKKKKNNLTYDGVAVFRKVTGGSWRRHPGRATAAAASAVWEITSDALATGYLGVAVTRVRALGDATQRIVGAQAREARAEESADPPPGHRAQDAPEHPAAQVPEPRHTATAAVAATVTVVGAAFPVLGGNAADGHHLVTDRSLAPALARGAPALGAHLAAAAAFHDRPATFSRIGRRSPRGRIAGRRHRPRNVRRKLVVVTVSAVGFPSRQNSHRFHHDVLADRREIDKRSAVLVVANTATAVINRFGALGGRNDQRERRRVHVSVVHPQSRGPGLVQRHRPLLAHRPPSLVPVIRAVRPRASFRHVCPLARHHCVIVSVTRRLARVVFVPLPLVRRHLVTAVVLPVVPTSRHMEPVPYRARWLLRTWYTRPLYFTLAVLSPNSISSRNRQWRQPAKQK